jgi:pantoate--beta-alanine ligase
MRSRSPPHARARAHPPQVERLQRPLCGASRPHHFRGVATVVAKLFHIVEPDVAVFGRKDYQQWRLIARMARDLDFGVEVVGLPICREADGLAMSSRNARLSPEARAAGLCIVRGLRWAEAAAAAAAPPPPAELAAHVAAEIRAAGGEVDYVTLAHADHLGPVTDVASQPTLLAVAAFFPARDGRGRVRLIDNTVLGGPSAA